MNTTSEFDLPNNNNSINNLPLESQLNYITTLKLIDQMSYEQLKDFTLLLFKTYTIQHSYLKDTLKNNLI